MISKMEAIHKCSYTKQQDPKNTMVTTTVLDIQTQKHFLQSFTTHGLFVRSSRRRRGLVEERDAADGISAARSD